MTTESVITAYFDNMAAMNAQGWREIFAEDALVFDPVGNPPTKPQEDADKFFDLLTNFFVKLELSQDHTFIIGNQAAVKWTMNVLAKNGKQASAEGISVFEINDEGKIGQVSAYWDEGKMMAQLKG